jgi:hypothetical protein
MTQRPCHRRQQFRQVERLAQLRASPGSFADVSPSQLLTSQLGAAGV